VLIFFLVVTHLRTRAQLNRVFYAVILTSLPIAIYGIIQHYGLDPLPWGGDVKERVAANMGNAIFVAAYLIIAWFLTLERLIASAASLLSEEKGTTADALRAGAYLFILIVQAIAIIFTQSRGPWLGWAAGLYVFGLMGVLLLGRWAAQRRGATPWLTNAVRPLWAAIIALTVAGLAFLIVFNLPDSPLAHLRQQRFIGRFGTVLSTTEGTNAVRVLIWEGVVDMMLKPHPPIQQPDGTPDIWNPIRPLIGYGPESMWVAYNRFYPPDLAHYEARNASPDRSHNETFDALVRTGLFGLGVQMWLYVSIFYYALRWLGLIQNARRRNLFLALLGSGALLGILVPLIVERSLRLAGIALPAGLIAGLIVYVTVDLWLVSGKTTPAAEDVATSAAAPLGGGRQQLLILTLLAAIIAHFVEIHFGIAIASTLTTFWTLAGVLVVVGMGWVREAEEQTEAVMPVVVAAPGAATMREEGHVSAAGGRGGATAPAATGKQKAGGRRAPARPATTPAGRRGAERPTPVRPAPTARRAVASPLITFLPYAGIAALITLILTWNYLINQTGAQAPLDILWRAFTLRTDNATFRVVQSPMLLVLMI
ncbi:MAG: O-antigen ligase family protein, partial [Anaerolineae bacterium]|nr:O-antigen ligase family protein [Anaerolineae bacterium]